AVLPNDFKLTDTTVSNELKVYTINQNSFIYGIEADTQIEYLSQVQPENEYIHVSSTTIDGVNGQVEYLILAGEKGIALTHASSATLKQVVYDTQVSENVYVATDVNVYYLPIITKTNAYTLVQNDNIVRLTKGTVFSPEYKFTFAGIEYYYANLGTTDSPVYGYLPVNFTVKVLADNVEYSHYTVERISQTTLYSDQSLTQAILDIPDGETVRVYENNNGVLRVWYKTANGYIEGYISSSAIVDNPIVQIRNILVVLAVSACLCGSITYFVLRSKRD
ncbi:MAG: hypothetical protein J6R83_02030, partial [Clostridia bacterium]|nr:hypothetical protein [Clostridia bacterium]